MTRNAQISALVTGPALVAFLALAASCVVNDRAPPSRWEGEIATWGTLREALRDGHVQARVAVDDVARPGVWAVGALEDLRGEVTIADGEVWVSQGGAASVYTTRGASSGEQATVLFAATVHEWTEVPVPEAVDGSVLEAFIAQQAREHGVDPSRPFPFVVEGGLRALQAHVIAGACPMRARMLGTDPNPAPYTLASEVADGRLVGIFAEQSSGMICHAGSRAHVHALVDGYGPHGEELTAHVEWVGLEPGAVLKLPAR